MDIRYMPDAQSPIVTLLPANIDIHVVSTLASIIWFMFSTDMPAKGPITPLVAPHPRS